MKRPHVSIYPNQFSSDLYPEVTLEINVIVRQIVAVPGLFKSEILISFLKGQGIHSNWLVDNKALVEIVTSGFTKANRTVKLLSMSRNNRSFIKGFEEYVKRKVLAREKVSAAECALSVTR